MSIEDWEREVEEMFQRMQTPEFAEAANRLFNEPPRVDLRNWSDKYQDGYLSTNPEVSGGRTVFRGTRVPLKSMYDYRKAGDSLEDWMAGYPSVERWRAEAVWQWSDDVIEEWIAKGEPDE